MAFQNKNLITISNAESQFFEIVKWLLMLQVMFGHIIALLLPERALLNTKNITDLIYLGLKFFFRYGRESAIIFVFLSGFFSYRAFMQPKKEISFLGMLHKRIQRIYPLYLLCLVFTVLLDFIGIFLVKLPLYDQNNMAYNVIGKLTPAVFLGNFLSLQPTFTASLGSNGPLWTIGYLMQFFFIATFVLFASKKINCSFILLMLIVVAIILMINLEFGIFLTCWFTGMQSRSLQLPKVSKIGKFVLLIMVFALIILSKQLTLIPAVICATVAGQLLLIISKGLQFSSMKIPNSELAYAMYLFHMPVVFFVLGCFTTYFDVNFISSILMIIVCGASAISSSFLMLRTSNIMLKKS